MKPLDPTAIKVKIDPLIAILNTGVLPLLFIIATAVFIWGIILYIGKSSDEATQRKAKIIIFWGIIGLTVSLASWGIVKILITYFGVGGTGIPTPNPLTL